MTEEQNQNNNVDKYKEIERPPSYDKVGLVLGAVVGILATVCGFMDIMMNLTVFMFLGLLIGSFIKKK